MATKTFKRVFKYTLVAMLTIFILIMVFISPFAKYWIEKNDERLLGRRVEIGWAYANPFTGYIHLHDIQVYEVNGDSIFLSAKGVSADIALRKLFFKTLEFSRLKVDQPNGIIYQNKEELNFDDLIARFTPDSTKTPSIHVALLETEIVDAQFRYVEKVIPINYFIKNVNIESSKGRGMDTLHAKFSFLAGIGSGEVHGKIKVNLSDLHYQYGVEVKNYDMEIIRQYIWELINYGMFTAHVDANLQSSGNFHSRDSMESKGNLTIRDFHLGKTTADDYVAFNKLQLVIDQLNPANHKYSFDSMILDHPYLKYEKFDSLDNVEAMFGKKGKNISDITSQPDRFNLVIELARYLKDLSRNFFQSQYKIRKLAIREAEIKFNDYSKIEKFSIAADPLFIYADSIGKDRKRIELSLKSGVKPFGKIALAVSINPRDSGDFDLNYHVRNIPASLFNPYLISFTSFPLDRGRLELNGTWNVRDSKIKSNNHLVVIDPRVTKRIHNEDTKRIPLPFIMSLIRETGNVIDYEIPITGNIKNPKFHWGDVIFDLIKNIFTKPPMTPYRMEVKQLEMEIEKALTVKWEMKQKSLWPHQEKFVNKIVKFLKTHPDATITVNPVQYSLKEKEYILFFETKKKYFLIRHPDQGTGLSEKDSTEVDEMSAKDYELTHYLSRNLSDTVMFTLQEKCFNFVGNKLVNKKFDELVKARHDAFLSPFIDEGLEKRVIFRSSENNVPFDGFSYFRLTYPGEIPAELTKAYQKMNELNAEIPRKEYAKLRKKDAAGVEYARP